MDRDEIDVLPSSTKSLCLSMGIYIMSFSGHPCLPSIYRAMKRPEAFERMLDCCFMVMAASYTLISVAGYLTFGEDTNVLITANLLTQNGYLSKTLIVLVAAGCYFQTSPMLAVMAEIPENNVFQFSSDSVWKIRAFRTAVFLFISGASYLCIDYLPLIEAITGSMATMIVSVICPALFYRKLVIDSECRQNKGLLQHSTASPMFRVHPKAPKMMEMHNCWRDRGIKVILYLYAIVGTLFGLYMFCTDIMNAVG